MKPEIDDANRRIIEGSDDAYRTALADWGKDAKAKLRTSVRTNGSLPPSRPIPDDDTHRGTTSRHDITVNLDMSVVLRVAAPAPQLDLNAFGALHSWLVQTAETKGAPVDYVAVALLGIAAGVVGAARWVSPWDGWREPAVLWIMLVGSPSASKSPAIDALQAPLKALERDEATSWPETRRSHEAAKVVAKARRDEWEAKARAAVSSGEQEPPLPIDADPPQEPRMPRIAIADATIEKAAIILSGNPRGLVLLRDECAAWLANLGKHGEGDRAFWLEAYGARPTSVDRVKHPDPIDIEHLAISIAGGIQPDRLATLLINGDDDGLAARFLYTWPEPVAPQRPTNKADVSTIARTLKRLRSLAFRPDVNTGQLSPVTLPIDEDALRDFQQWRLEHFAASTTTSGLVSSAFGKMGGQVLRVALLLELLWWAAGPDGVAEPTSVSGRALGTALDLNGDYFKPMLSRTLGEAALPVVDRNAATLAREILKRKASRINARTVRREWRLAGLADASAVNAAIDALAEAGWLVPAKEREGGTTGRRREDYVVNPSVHEARS